MTPGPKKPVPSGDDAIEVRETATGEFQPGSSSTHATDEAPPTTNSPLPAEAASATIDHSIAPSLVSRDAAFVPETATGHTAQPQAPLPTANAPLGPAPAESDQTGVFITVRGTGAGGVPVQPPAESDQTGVFVTTRGTRAGGTEAQAATGVAHPTGDFRPTQVATSDGAAPPAGAPAGPTAPHCGRYVLKRFHAKGGMGEIWLAEDPEIGRQVALKRMLTQRTRNVYRFRVEAQVTGQLEHPGVVPVHELGYDEDGQPFYVMKFVHGRTLQKAVEAFHRLPTDDGVREVELVRLLQMFMSLCQTVGYAHSRGVLHRDLKPENVMLGPYGETLLLDWGIAKVVGQPGDERASPDAEFVHVEASDEETQTQAGAVLGTPAYMAPEVARGRNADVDERSDIYLLGGTLYEILTGRQPRISRTALEMVKLAQNEPPPPVRRFNPAVSKALEAICARAMAFEKADRYPTALALAEDLQRYLAGEPVTALREGPLRRAWRWAKRHRKAIAASLASLATVSLLLWGYTRLQQAERDRIAAVQVAAEARERDLARAGLREFRRLADEARYYAATTDPVSEHAPYFDPRKGEAIATRALDIAARWGPTAAALPLPEERDSVQKELYDLLLITAQTRAQRVDSSEEARSALALLDRARALRGPSRGYDRVRAEIHERIGDNAAAARDRAESEGAPETPLDHFLLGEDQRRAAHALLDRPTERSAWQPDPVRMADAIAHYRKALAIEPGHYWSHLQLGRSYLALGRFGEAVEALGTCVSLQPDSPWGYGIRGVALAQQGRFAEAEQDLDRAVELGPGSRLPRLNRGAVLWMQGKPDEALIDLNAVLQPPDADRLVEAAFYRGQLFLQRGEISQGLQDLNLVLAEQPYFKGALLHRTRVLVAQGDTAAALKDLDTIISIEVKVAQGSWESHAHRGRLLRLLYGDLPIERRRQPAAQALLALALAELRKAESMQGQAPQIYDDLGAMLQLAGRHLDAIAAYSKGIALAPRHVKLLVKRAWAYDLIKQPDRAAADFLAAVQVEPDHAEAHAGLGYLRAVAHAENEAQREAELALLYADDNYLILHNVACIYGALAAESKGPHAAAYQDVAMALIHRAVEVWKRSEANPSEIELIKVEPAFRALSARDDFRQLIQDADARRP